jgi:hypothetical protein
MSDPFGMTENGHNFTVIHDFTVHVVYFTRRKYLGVGHEKNGPVFQFAERRARGGTIRIVAVTAVFRLKHHVSALAGIFLVTNQAPHFSSVFRFETTVFNDGPGCPVPIPVIAP